MNKVFMKFVFLFCLMSVQPVGANTTDKELVDTVLNYSFVGGKIVLEDGQQGKLYQYAHDEGGYDLIYYLFTDCRYLHLDCSDVAEGTSSFYCFSNGFSNNAGTWYNMENRQRADENTKWPLMGTDVKKHANRVLKRGLTDSSFLLFNADSFGSKKKGGSSVLLVVLPALCKDETCHFEEFKVLLDNEELSLDKFKQKLDTIDRNHIRNVEFVINRTNRVVIDYIVANGKKITIGGKDTPIASCQKKINIKPQIEGKVKEIEFVIHYHFFKDDGELGEEIKKQILPLESVGSKGLLKWVIGLVLLVVVVVLLIEWMSHSINRRKGRSDSNEFGSNEDHNSEGRGGHGQEKETSTVQDEVGSHSSTNGDAENVSKEKDIDSSSLGPDQGVDNGTKEAESKDASMNQGESNGDCSTFENSETTPNHANTEENADETDPSTSKDTMVRSDRSSTNVSLVCLNRLCTDTVGRLKKRFFKIKEKESEIDNKDKEIEALTNNDNARIGSGGENNKGGNSRRGSKAAKKELVELRKQFNKVNNDLKKAIKDKEDSEIKAKEEIGKINKQLEEAIKAKEKAAEEAKKVKIDQVIAVENAVKVEKMAALKEKEKIETDYQQRLKSWKNDKDAIYDSIKVHLEKLSESVSFMSDDAFYAKSKTIRDGVETFSMKVKGLLGNIEWRGNTLADNKKELREICINHLQNSSDGWMHLLGRVYSYMSVDELRMNLSEEGLTFEIVSAAYTALESVLGLLNITIYNCSVGFDSGNNPIIQQRFSYNSSVDIVSSWLQTNSQQTIENVVPNHGRTVYDFGQLAYLISEEGIVHKGSVIYYNL